MPSNNIILTGFMGTGKTAVGQAIAERLGRWFVDVDAVIERQAGRPIHQIFAQDGEPAFRALETEVIRSLTNESNLVISTGGGALLSPINRQRLQASGVLVCLRASVDTLLARLADTTNRPLLAGPDRRARIATLLAQRAALYDAIPLQVDTDRLSVPEVAEAVIRLARQAGPGPQRIPVIHPAGSYDILIGEGLLNEAGPALLAAGLAAGACAIVTQPALIGHASCLADALQAQGFRPTVIEIPAGEQYKTLATVADLYDAFIAAGLDRRSPVLALGGGVVGDVAGFAAASFLRGVPFVQIPTSLLAMVDASVGGKTGVDLPQGKNLVGAFKQPALVLMDPETLASLPSDEFRSGLAEVVKHGMIGDPDLFEVMEGRAVLALSDLLARAVQVKVDVVQQDPFEQGRRAVLNLGHTFAHPLETLSNYQMRHGEAVSIGLVMATRLAARLGVCEAALVVRLESALERLGLPTRAPGFDPAQVVAGMSTDKKRVQGRLRFVLPRALGDVEVFDAVPAADVLMVVESVAS